MSAPSRCATSLADVLAEIRRHWTADDQLAESTIEVYARVHADLVAFLDRGEAEPSIDDATPEQVAAFAASRTRRGRPASAAFQALRLAALDTTFTTARQLGLTTADPTRRLVRPARGGKARAGCTPTQLNIIEAVVREYGLQYRASAIVALAVIGASSSEIPTARIRDVDNEHAPAMVRLAGNYRRAARRVPVRGFAAEVIAARCAYLRAHGADDDTPLVRPGQHGQEGICVALRELLGRGPQLGTITARSLNALAAAHRYQETGDLAAAADLLGTVNYNAVAKLIATVSTKPPADADGMPGALAYQPSARSPFDRRPRIASYILPSDPAHKAETLTRPEACDPHRRSVAHR